MILLLVYLLWVFYLAIMNLKRAEMEGRLPVWAKRLAYPMLIAGYLLDFLANIFIMTIIMLELPKELLVTARVTRHKKEGKGYRKKVADWMCATLLDEFDPKGCHCR